jgi:hypothetical protein
VKEERRNYGWMDGWRGLQGVASRAGNREGYTKEIVGEK